MKCRCGYEGEAEYGEFDDPDFPTLKIHIRCPMCLQTRHIIIEVHEHIKMAILYPEYCHGSVDYGKHEKTKKVVMILRPSAEGALAGYSIYCPVCTWGEGGGLEPERAKYLLALQEGTEVEGVPSGHNNRATDVKEVG